SPGHAVVVRFYPRERLPFASLGAPCPQPEGMPPLLEHVVETASVTTPITLVLAGVVEGAPVRCVRGCPPPRVIVLNDDLTTAPGQVRLRLIQGVPNLIAPIHVCFDPDFEAPDQPGPAPPQRILPPEDDFDGIGFGEVTPYIQVPPLSSTPGAFFVHLTVPGPPDCSPSTLALGPITLPFPVPETAPPEVARTLDPGDVLSLFAFGRVGDPCRQDSDCAALGGRCLPMRMICQDRLSPSMLPWKDVRGVR
ncbi:MAG: hypothetical protein N2515_02140, partial [Deltaproteobacteria bacterium]|nr:hypothetical protein [Deltaproteobacteria bacterium]